MIIKIIVVIITSTNRIGTYMDIPRANIFSYCSLEE